MAAGYRASSVRLYVDFVRGTPVFVLVLASFYLLTQIGIQLDRVPGRPVRAGDLLQHPCRREPARRAAVAAARPDRGGQGDRPDLSADSSSMCWRRRRCARRCRPGSTRRPRWSRPRRCSRSSALPSCCWRRKQIVARTFMTPGVLFLRRPALFPHQLRDRARRPRRSSGASRCPAEHQSKSMAQPILQIENLHKKFKDVEVLKGVDLSPRDRRRRLDHRLQRLGQDHAAALRQHAGGVPRGPHPDRRRGDRL